MSGLINTLRSVLRLPEPSEAEREKRELENREFQREQRRRRALLLAKRRIANRSHENLSDKEFLRSLGLDTEEEDGGE